jgi:hypothetical protein
MARIKKTCACGFETDWPPAWALHVKPDPTEHYEVNTGGYMVPPAPDPDETTVPMKTETAPDEPSTSDTADSDGSPVEGTHPPSAQRTIVEDRVAALLSTGLIPASHDCRCDHDHDPYDALAFEHVETLLELTITRLALGQYEETDRIVDDLDRAMGLTRQLRERLGSPR